jgi:hypothetical protein
MSLWSRKSTLVLAAALLVVPAGYAAGAAMRSPHRALEIRGGLARPLFPGGAQALDLALTNRAGVALAVTRLRVRLSVDRAHRRAGCSARRDFVVGRLPRSAFPIRLPGRRSGRTGRPVPTTRTLTALGLRTLPWVGMRDLAAANQDACKGARLRLRFSGSARKAGRAR